MGAILKVLPLPKGRKSPFHGVAGMNLFPHRSSDGRTFVYVVAFKGGVVKVGISKTPRSRIRAHWKRASGEVEWAHLFPPMHRRTACMAEHESIRALSALGRQINRSEWFMCDVNRQAVIEAIRHCVHFSRVEMQARFAEETARKAERKAIAEALEKAGFESEAGQYLYGPHVRHGSRGEAA